MLNLGMLIGDGFEHDEGAEAARLGEEKPRKTRK